MNLTLRQTAQINQKLLQKIVKNKFYSSGNYHFCHTDEYMIVGPQTGIKDNNKEAFENCKKTLFRMVKDGIPSVVSVFDLCPDFDKHNKQYGMIETINFLTNYTYDKDYDIKCPQINALIVLPGWEKSAGTLVEMLVAMDCGIDIVLWEQ